MGLVSVPQLVPGLVDALQNPLVVENLFGSAQASGPIIRFVTESTATSAAAGVGEGSAKPESTIGLTTADEPVKKVATLARASARKF